jgi:hypothetical protein
MRKAKLWRFKNPVKEHLTLPSAANTIASCCRASFSFKLGAFPHSQVCFIVLLGACVLLFV